MDWIHFGFKQVYECTVILNKKNIIKSSQSGGLCHRSNYIKIISLSESCQAVCQIFKYFSKTCSRSFFNSTQAVLIKLGASPQLECWNIGKMGFDLRLGEDTGLLG